jgi:hypothetical protein
MGPTLTTVEQAEAVFNDPAVRAQVRQWHLEQVPLLEMVDRLGFGHTVDADLRAAIEGLKPEEVAIIRTVMLEEIDRAGTATEAKLPVDCTITRVTGPVAVSAEAEPGGRQVAHVVDTGPK